MSAKCKTPNKIDLKKLDLYRVKFEWNGETVYGLVDLYDRDSDEYAERGLVLVDHCVLRTRYALPPSKLTPMKCSFEPDDEFDQYVEQQAKEAQELHKSLPKDKLCVGHMFSIGVGDGYASYVVTKVFKKNCDIEWRGFCVDRWTDHHFGWGGRFPIDEIMRYVGP